MALLKSVNYASVGTVEAVVYTVPASTDAVIKEIIITNKLGMPVAGTMDYKKGAVRSRIMNPDPYFLPYETKVFSMSSFLNDGDTINVVSNANASLDIFVSLVETVVV